MLDLQQEKCANRKTVFVSDREKEVRKRERNGVGTREAGRGERRKRASEQASRKLRKVREREIEREKKGVQQKPT